MQYRKKLAGKRDDVSDIKGPEGIFFKILLVLAVVAVLYLIVKWLLDNPLIFFLLIAAAGTAYYLVTRKKRDGEKAFSALKDRFDELFVRGTVPPADDRIAELREARDRLLRNEKMKPRIERLEKEIYAAVIDRILEDKAISPDEKGLIEKLDTVIRIDEACRAESGRELFRLYYLDAVADRRITDAELETLRGIAEVLRIDEHAVREEMSIVEEMVRAQKLAPPLTPVEGVALKLPKNEKAYYAAEGKVLSRGKAKEGAEDEYEFATEREGPVVITDRRLLVVREGTTSVALKEILDIDVDLDRGMLILSKESSSAPVYIKITDPIYAGRVLDILIAEQRD